MKKVTHLDCILVIWSVEELTVFEDELNIVLKYKRSLVET